MNDPAVRAMVEEVTRKLADEGKMIEAGWEALRIMGMPEDCSPVQIREMRKAFFLGAQHLFASVIAIMTHGTEPTQDDMRRMSLIHQELDTFEKGIRAEAARRD